MNSISSRAFILLLAAAAALACLLDLGEMDVTTAHEGQRTTPPLEMIDSGDWVLPTLNGKAYLAKPPLLYWAIAGVYEASGRIDELTARLPNALAGIALVLAVYLLFRRPLGEAPARWAALLTLAAPYLLERYRMANLDTPLVLAILLAIVPLWHAWQSAGGRRWGCVLAAGLSFTAAVYLKGPVPFLFLLGAWLGWLVASTDEPDRVILRGIQLTAFCVVLEFLLMGLRMLGLPFPVPLPLLLFILGWALLALRAGAAWKTTLLPVLAVCGIALGLFAPWAVAVVSRFGLDNAIALFHLEASERTYQATAINAGTPLYFLLGLPVMLLPWGLLLPLHFSRRLWDANTSAVNAHEAALERRVGAYPFLLLAAWLSVGIFSLIAGKEYEYIIPVVPFLLAITGVHLTAFEQELLPRRMHNWVQRWQGFFFWFLVAAAAGIPLYVIIEQPDWTLLTLEAILCGAALALLLRLRWSPARAIAFALAAMLIVLGGLLTRSYRYTGDRSPEKIGHITREIIEHGHTVEATRIYPHFAFYAAHPVAEVIEPAEVLPRFQQGTPYFYLTREEFLNQFSDAATHATVVYGPIRNKELVLLTNDAGKAALEEQPLTSLR